ncbi:hypothetical protein SODALDRAFT_357286 [Sodiomyces alkalinus F11]|uniref:Uncharacterized protein n=1 Tax=Sodiomyces alkalinus (strain CBS 110278 / VKM F-3762 / F11) TaxID=1314773 RepID=A0A3N2Q3Q0_SODAK|nr:hypothetical protein SODALDRAFT_357286 [Sodiomyces alkalinus F11]ROT41255.1 hypothetical protein SODALDRAFT_357286 [Sodiomyces alkalinus F11]
MADMSAKPDETLPLQRFPPPPRPPSFRSSPNAPFNGQHRDQKPPSISKGAPPPPPPPPTLIPRSHFARSPSNALPREQLARPSFETPTLPLGPSPIPRTASNIEEQDGSPTKSLCPPTPRGRTASIQWSSPSSSPRHGGSDTEDDSSDEEEDYYDHWNRNFPPLMPTVGPRVSIARKRRLVTKNISNRVSRYERRSPAQSEPTSDTSSDIASENSEDEAQLLWVQLKEKRQRLDETKQAMAARRKQLRELRRRKDEADNAFMGLLRPLFQKSRRGGVHSTSDELLDRRFNEMQRLRTEYHYLESAYEGLEVALDEQEEDLNKLEVRFFSLLATGRSRSARAQTRKSDTDPRASGAPYNVPHLLLGISPEGPPLDDVHPLWRDLVSAIGDFNLAQEELDDLLFRREQIAYELELKKGTGKTPTEEEEEFMAEFPGEERERRRKADEMAEEMRRLRRLCRDHGVEVKHPSFEVAYALDRNIGEDMTLSNDDARAESKSLAHHRFPELLSQPDHVLRRPEPLTVFDDLKQAAKLPAGDAGKNARMHVAVKEYGIHDLVHGFKGGDRLELVARWLLYQLRTNPLEAYLLSNTFLRQTGLKVLDRHRWTRDVLYHWWRDGTRPASNRANDGGEAAADSSMYGHKRSPSASRAASEYRHGGRVRLGSDEDDSKTVS